MLLSPIGPGAPGCGAPAPVDPDITVSLPPDMLPPDGGTAPSVPAPPLDRTVATTVYDATRFVYTGPDPLQTGVGATTIQPGRAAVLRGQITDRQQRPLVGVAITVLGHPEYGATRTRADGFFDLVVNGGADLTVSYAATGFIPAQRQAYVPWQTFVTLRPAVLLPYDTQVTTVRMGAAAPQVAQGSVTSDGDGVRQATLLFPAGTQATLQLPDGSTRALATLHVRATEMTVGARGPDSMPADLPRSSGYTYAVELSADEAQDQGELRFSQPARFYVENFLHFPVGGAVPMGSYDRTRGVWIPSPNGRVIQVLGGAPLADLDLDGDGRADSAAALVALGIDDDERRALATRFQAGQSLWRVPTPHFSTWDANWPVGPTPGATPPQSQPKADHDKDDPCREAGSLIECQNQILGEQVPITGTPLQLHYRSDRVPGRSQGVDIPITAATLPPGLQGVSLTVNIAGRSFPQSFPAAPNLQTRFLWDGKDVYGRRMQGRQPVTVSIGYTYAGVYQDPAQLGASFGALSGVPLNTVPARTQVTLSQQWQDQLDGVGGFDIAAAGLGGWSLGVHHVYDPTAQVLYLGTGERRSAYAINPAVTLLAGSSVTGFAGDGGRADRALISYGAAVAVAADGTVYLADSLNNRVRRISPDRVITTVAGTGVCGFSGDGGPAARGQLCDPDGLALSADGSLYIADTANHRVRRVAPDGTLGTVAGTGVSGLGGDGGPAGAAQLQYPQGVALGPDGTLYIADTQNGRVRRIGTDGIISNLAGGGDGTSGINLVGDGGPANRARLSWPVGLSVSPDGALYIADNWQECIRRVDTGGLINTVGGFCNPFRGAILSEGEGGPATEAFIQQPRQLALGPDGSLYFSVFHGAGRIKPDGILVAAAGSGTKSPFVSQAPATSVSFNSGDGLAFGPDGRLYLADQTRLVRINSAFPGFDGSQIVLPSADGAEVYVFDARGRHLRTLDGTTLTPRWQFTYSPAGYLTGIVDVGGNRTTIERDDQGGATAIVSPYGQRTALTLDAAGYLAQIQNPAGESRSFQYDAGGLLTRLQDARGGVHSFTYDDAGRLRRDADAAGGWKALARSAVAGGAQVDLTTAQGLQSSYKTEVAPDRAQHLLATGPSGEQIDTRVATDGTTRTLYPDGTQVVTSDAPDPRFGMQVALQSQVTTTPSGLSSTLALARSAVLADPDNPLSLKTQTDTRTVNGRAYTTVTDTAARTVTRTTPLGRKSLFTADDHGRISSMQVPGQPLIQLTYDAQGRLARIQSGARAQALTYDARGFVASQSDALGRTVSLQRDAAGRLTQQTLPDGRVIGYSYDRSGNLTALTPPSRPAHALAYTAADQLSSYTPPDTGAGLAPVRYTYDLDHRPTGISLPDGRAVALTYTRDRLTRVALPGGEQIALAYGPSGALETVTAPDGGQISYTYDGRLLTGLTYSGAVAGSVERTYTSDHRVLSETVGGSAPISFQYDQDDLVRQAGALSVTRDPQTALVTGVQLGGVNSVRSHDEYGAVTADHATHLGVTLWAQDRVLDVLGRVVKSTETTPAGTHVQEYTYDGAYRLSQVKQDGALVASYTYDGNGNRTQLVTPSGSRSGTYDAQDRLLTYGTLSYSYGAAGELQKKTDSATGKSTTYTQDMLGNLRAVGLPDGRVVNYVVDGNRRRIGKKIGGALVQGLIYDDGQRVLAELSGGGALVSRFVYAGPDPVPDYLIKGGATYRILKDHRGSPRVVVDVATGTVAQRLDFDEFGRVVTDSNPGFQPFGFDGGLYDRDTGLVRFGARDYDPETGRWIARDPLGFAGGDTNLYGYVVGDPINLIDPSGQRWGFGVYGSLSFEAGLFAGLGAGASGGFGYFEKGFGAFFGVGGAVGLGPLGLSYPARDPLNVDTQQPTFFYGTSAPSASVGLFFTNARCAQEMNGPGQSYSLSTPWIGLQFSYGQRWDGGTSVMVSVTKSVSPSLGLADWSISSYASNTDFTWPPPR